MRSLGSSPYQQHIFICNNQKAVGKASCHREFTQLWIKALKESLKPYEGIRVTESLCLGQCQQGPIVMIYPMGQLFQINEQESLTTNIANLMQVLNIK